MDGTILDIIVLKPSVSCEYDIREIKGLHTPASVEGLTIVGLLEAGKMWFWIIGLQILTQLSRLLKTGRLF